MLVVTGTQRSGTSLIAMALEESGYNLGSTLWDEAVLGGFDNDLICGFYQQYLGDPTFPFDDYEWPIVEPEQFRAMDYKVVKFCYLLMNPAFVTIWHKFRPKGDAFLTMDRRKRHVITSKRRLWSRFSHDSPLLVQGKDRLQGNFNSSIELLARYDYRFRILPFPECVSDLGEVNAALARLDPNVQIDPGVWERVYDPTKIHFT